MTPPAAMHVILFEAAGSNLANTLTAVRGDAEAAFKTAPYTRRERFKVQRHTAVPMEPRGLLAEWDAARGVMTVFGAAKVPFPNRRMLAKHLGLPETSVRMIEKDVGGGFGVRGEFYPEDFLIPFAARLTGRPVKWIEDRREHLLATNHARDAECDIEIACERDGTIVGLRAHAFADLGAYVRTIGATPARNVAQILPGPYRIPHVRIDIALLMTNKTPVGTYRGPGRFEADFFRERLFDMAAQDLGLDRVEFRRRNLIRRSRDALSAAEGAGARNRDRQRQRRLSDHARPLPRRSSTGRQKSALQGKLIDGRYHGLALGCYIEGGASGPREHVRLVLETDGTVVGVRRLVRHRPGARDGLRADRRRRARNADGAHPRRVPRLDRPPAAKASAPTARAPW